MRHKLLLIVLLMGMVMIFPPHEAAFACSGGDDFTTLHTALENADVLVKAEVIETDDASKNGILHVEQYLMGSGPEYLLLYRAPPALAATYYARHYDTGCLYGGPDEIYLGMEAYYALSHLANGSYGYRFLPVAGTPTTFSTWFPNQLLTRIDPAGEDIEANIQTTDLASAEQFEVLVQGITGETPSDPLDAPRPRQTPLLITTENGTHYMLPVDDGPPIELAISRPVNQFSSYAYPDVLQSPPMCNHTNPCQLWTPDHSLNARFTDNPEEIMVDYYPYTDLGRDPEFGPPEMPILLSGDAFAFSSTGEALVIWQESEMRVYLVNTAYCECMYGEFVPRLDLLTSISLNTESPDREVRWSADGTTLAYWDNRGVWLLDIFRMGAPELVLEAIEGVEQLKPLFLSTTGRFLAYATDPIPDPTPNTARGEMQNWLTLDRISGLTYENAIFSPNERYFVQIAPENPAERPDVAGCKLPIAEDCHTIFWDAPQRFEWINDDQFYAVTCQANALCELKGTLADYVTFHTGQDRAGLPDTAGKIHAVAYEPEQNLYAVAVGPRNLLLLTDPPDSRFLDSSLLELGDVLDGDIVQVAWLPSLFYREN